MKILCIADLHCPTYETIQKIWSLPNNTFDAVILLGDISESAIVHIAEKYVGEKPIAGVVGNHDDFEVLTDYGITDLHNNITEINGVKFGGIYGSYKYKNSYFPALWQDEADDILDNMDYVDILVSHTSPYEIHQHNEDSHCGFEAINNYIERHTPVYNLHGHQHINKKTVLSNGTTVLGIYSICILDLISGDIQHIF